MRLVFVLFFANTPQSFEEPEPVLPLLRPILMIGLITIDLGAVWRDSMDACPLSL